MTDPDLAAVLTKARSIALQDLSGFDTDRVEAFAVTLASPDGAFPAGLGNVEQWLDPDESATAVLRIDENFSKLVGESFGSLVAEIASLIQDAVVGDTGQPWPISRGRVLDAVVVDGEAQWTDRSTQLIPIGSLLK